jgi:hypothetical protein
LSAVTLLVCSIGLASPSHALAEDAATPEFSARFYGILLPSIIGEVGGVESFGRANTSAPTGAAMPMFISDLDAARTTFQVQQTRLGFHASYGDLVHGQAEVDFVDFGKASPTVQALPRLRIASVDWKLADHHCMILGQFWDVFSPVNPILANLVGSSFTAGNSGFMRHQLAWLYDGSVIRTALAIGLPSPNATPTDANIEQSLVPTVAGRLGFVVPHAGEIGISAIFASVKQGSDGRLLSIGANLYASLRFADAVDLKAEAYFGQNLANLSSLTLGQGSAAADVREVGGFVSSQWDITPSHAIYGTVGYAMLLNPDDAALGYSQGADGSYTRDLASGLGIENNLHIRAGYAYELAKGLRLQLEPFFFRTQFKLADAEENQFDSARMSYGVEFASVYRF